MTDFIFKCPECNNSQPETLDESIKFSDNPIVSYTCDKCNIVTSWKVFHKIPVGDSYIYVQIEKAV